MAQPIVVLHQWLASQHTAHSGPHLETMRYRDGDATRHEERRGELVSYHAINKYRTC